MSEGLRRNIASPGKRDRYGTWDLSSDRPPPPASPIADYRVDEEEYLRYEEEVRLLIRRQRRLSLTAACLLFGPVFAVTVASFIWVEAFNRPVWQGFSLALLFGALVVYPLTWLVAAVYTVVSNRLDGLR